jgi:hypothetical protein
MEQEFSLWGPTRVNVQVLGPFQIHWVPPEEEERLQCSGRIRVEVNGLVRPTVEVTLVLLEQDWRLQGHFRMVLPKQEQSSGSRYFILP